MRQQMIALVDCIAFYANVERQFHAALENCPIIVLSNNDGNIVSLSPEARALGFKRGMAYHQCRHLIYEHRVAVFSSNFALYQDVSDRIGALLADFALVRDGTAQQERYSIDESFLDISHVPAEQLLDYGRRMQATVLQATGIGVRIGIAPTKMLTKVAAEIAKREPVRGDVVNLAGLSEQELDAILETMGVEDLWGIGKRRAQVLEAQEIFTAEILKYTPPSRGRYLLGVIGERMIYELRGLSCIPLEVTSKPKQGILVSRAFGRAIEHKHELAEAVAHYTALAAMKLRHQESVATQLSLFTSSNHFDTASVPYASGASQRFPFATDFTPDLIAVAHTLLQQIYRPGIQYHRAGVYLAEIGPRDVIQPDLFGSYDVEQEARKARLMAALDIITAFCGREALFFGAQGITRPWQSRATRRSGAYTTRWSDLLIVSAR